MTRYHQRRRPLLGCLLVALVAIVAAAIQVAFWVTFIRWVVSL